MNLHTSCKLRFSLDLKGYSRENWREMSDLYHKIGILMHTGQNIMCYQVLYTEKLYKFNYNACHILTAKYTFSGRLLDLSRKKIWDLEYKMCFICTMFPLYFAVRICSTYCTWDVQNHLHCFKILVLIFIWEFGTLQSDDLILFGNRLSFCKVDLQNNGFPKTKKQQLDFTAWVTRSHCQAKRVWGLLCAPTHSKTLCLPLVDFKTSNIFKWINISHTGYVWNGK